jgi:hypothetical protein
MPYDHVINGRPNFESFIKRDCCLLFAVTPKGYSTKSSLNVNVAFSLLLLPRAIIPGR